MRLEELKRKSIKCNLILEGKKSKKINTTLITLANRAKKVFANSKDYVLKAINNATDAEFKKAKDDVFKIVSDEDFEKLKEIGNLSIKSGRGLVATGKGPKIWMHMDPSEVDYSEFFSKLDRKQLQSYMIKNGAKTNLTEGLSDKLKSSARIGFLKVAIFMYFIDKKIRGNK